MIRRNKYLRFSRTPRSLLIFSVATILLALLAPMNFVLMTPGAPTSLFPKILTISGVKSYPSDGEIYLLTVYITNPETHIPGAFVLDCWAQADCVTMPRSVYYQGETSNKEEIAAGQEDMSQSQESAVRAAIAEMKARFPQVDVSGFNKKSLSVKLKDTGGPSGGLVFGLGIVELLTPEDILQGRKIAGTGTISDNGDIGAIGGVVEKIIGAKSAGASILFISQENCSELPQEIDGITIVAVSSLDQAVSYLLNSPIKGSNAAVIQGCASVGA